MTMHREIHWKRFVWVLLLLPLVAILVTSVMVFGQEQAEPPQVPQEVTPGEVPVESPETPPPPEPPSPPEAKQEWLNVIGVVPLPGDLLENLIVVFFDADIAPPTPPESAYRFNPNVVHGFAAGPNYIAFRSTNFPKDAVVVLHLTDAIKSRDGKVLNPTRREFVFTRFRFMPMRVFEIEETPTRTALGVAFPMPVNADELRHYLEARTLDGRQVPYTIEPNPDGRIPAVILENFTDWPVELIFREGLPDASGKLRLEHDGVFRYPAEPYLRVVSVGWGEFVPEYQEISVHFTQPVHPEALRQYLTLEDMPSGTAIPYELTTEGESTVHQLVVHLNTATRVAVRLTIEAGLPGAKKTRLKDRYQGFLEREPIPQQLVEYWWDRPRKEGLALFVQFSFPVKAADLAAHLSFSPELPGMRVMPAGGSSFRIYGEWKSKQNYTMKIAAGLPYEKNLILKQEITASLRTEELPRYLDFGYEGFYYFPRQAGVPLSLHSRNVEKVKLTLYRLFPSNLPMALDDFREEEYYGGYAGRLISKWCEKVSEMELPLPLDRDQVTKTPIDVQQLFSGGTRGVFCLEAREERGVSATKILIWTDLGLLAHWQSEELALFVHDLYSLAPIPSASVTIYSDKNQVMAQGPTGPDGMAHLGIHNPSLGEPRVVVVEHATDYTFLELRSRHDDPVAFAAGMPSYDRAGYDAFLYADRELYRPGENVHLHWIVRTNYGDAVGELPLVLRITKPNGRPLLEQPITLSALGTGGHDLETQKVYPTGRYRAELRVPDKPTPIGWYSFNLEEFVPNRIKVSVDVPDSVLIAGKAHPVHVHAEHLFGGAASDRKCEVTVVLQRKGVELERWKEFRFDNDSEFRPDMVPCGQKRTDAEGNATFEFLYRPPAEVTFPLKVVVVGRVFELGGRAVTTTSERVLLPSEVCLGIGASRGPGGQGIEVRVAAVNADQSPAALEKVNVTLEKRIWSYYVRRYYSHHEPRWSESFEPIETREVPLAEGKGSTLFEIADYGEYRVRVHSEATPQYSTLSFYSYAGQCYVVDAARPSLIKLVLDKEVYEIGDVAEVRIESPFDGKGVVVLQGETIQRMVAVDIQNGVGFARFDITRDQFPNVWVEATVIHAVKTERTQVYPFSSVAMANLPVRDISRKLDVNIAQKDVGALPEEVRPATQVTFAIETRSTDGAPAEAELTLAAVDEGIHLVTGYQSPDPYAWVGRSRQPDYHRAHYYDKVAYDFEKPAAGGGLDALVGKRAVSPDESWIKPVALWSGTIQTDPNGLAQVTFDIPEFTGQLRLVAVACSKSALGSQSANIFVRRPYMLRTSMPRFLLPGDVAHCRAEVFNHTDAPVSARVSWSASGALRAGEGSQVLPVAAHGEANLTATFTAGGRVEQGAIRWEVAFLDAEGRELEHVVEEAPLPVRAPAAYQSHHELIVLAPGENRTVRNVRFLDDDRAEIAITVGANPMLRLTKALEHVVGYPYGCVEQVTSRLFPMYLLRASGGLFGEVLQKSPDAPEKITEDALGNLTMYLNVGINKLFAMQTLGGGLATWPGGNTTYPYGSTYALHFLTLVKNDREFELPNENFLALQRYVRDVALDWTDETESGHYLRAYAIYALALDGNLEAIRQIGRFDNVELPTSARFLLAAALAMTTQDMNRVKLYLSSKPSRPYEVTEPDGTLISDIRNTAVELIALREMEGDPAEIAARADKLISFLEKRHYGTTQETAFIVAALAEYLRELGKNVEEAAATIAGPQGEAAITGREVYRGRQEGAGGSFTVTNTGKTNQYINVTTRGVPEVVNLEPVAKDITVTRNLYTYKGEPVGLEFNQGEAYVVKVEVSTPRILKNVVVVDLLPAGFEVENPRLDADAIPGGKFADAFVPSFMDVRDDRIVLACDSLEGTYRFYYVVRAVTPGTYQYPAIETECMYDASVQGRSVPSSIEVR